MNSGRNRRRKRAPRPERKKLAPRELPFYRLLPVNALKALEKGLVMRELEDKWTTSFARGNFDIYYSWSQAHVYRLAVRENVRAVEVGPALLMAAEPLFFARRDEEHLMMLELVLKRVLGEDTRWVAFNANLRGWTAQIIREFRGRKGAKRGRRGSSLRNRRAAN
jgi:hypothetical protein